MHQAPLVLANILAPVIIDLFKDGLGDLVAPGGYLILSGILDHQAERVQAAGSEAGFKTVQTAGQEDWVALVLEKPIG